MGKIKLIKLPADIKAMLKDDVAGKRSTMVRNGATSYTYEEKEKYLRMYLSGYVPTTIAAHYDVTPIRVYNGIPQFTSTRGYYRQLFILNRKKQKLKHKLVTVKEFFDNEMYTFIV